MSHKILVVEDDFDIRDSLDMVLSLEGFEVSTATNGQEALNYLNTNSGNLPSIILLDMMMPIMDGPTFLKKIEETSFNQIPVIILSAAKPIDLPAFKVFIKKPVDLNELIKALNSNILKG